MNTSNLRATDNKAIKQKRNGFERMDAIAYGVRARFEESTGFIKKITDTTVNVAKALGVPEKEIDNWVEIRLSQTSSETAIVAMRSAHSMNRSSLLLK